MRKYIFAAIITLVIVLALYLFFKPRTEFKSVECFDYYKFGDKFFEHSIAEKELYNARDNVTFFYIITNPMNIPITNLAVRVQILYEGNEIDRLEGNDLIDELVVLENVNLNPGDSYSGEFDWKIPEDVKSGTYLASFYLSSEEMFILSGISFMSNFAGSTASFNVNSEQENMIRFDRTSTYINETKYEFRALPQIFTSDIEVNITTRLINDGPEKDVNILYQVFRFDDFDSSKEIEYFRIMEDVKLKDNSVTPINFNLKNLESETYLVKITAKNENQKSILSLRIVISGERDRFVFLGLDKFPNVQKKSSIVFCLTNGATFPGDDTTSERNIKVELMDEKENVIFEGINKVIVDGSARGYMFTFNPKNVYSYVILKASTYDESGINERMTIIYDHSKFWNISRNFDAKILTQRVEFGENLRFSVSFKDDFGNALQGDIFSYISDSYGRVMTTLEEKNFLGSKEFTVPANFPAGKYELIVIERMFEKSISKEFTVT